MARAGVSAPARAASSDLLPAPPALEPPPVEVAIADGAAVLFADAVRARRDGQPQRAIALFRELQRQSPATPEARVSLISLGDLLLGSGGDAIGALAAFDEYLRLQPAGPLLPEALAGRLRALIALGRRSDAEAARRELEARSPGSAYLRAQPSPGAAP